MSAFDIIAITAATVAFISLWVVIARWQCDRAQSAAKLVEWQRLLDSELRQAREDRDTLLNALNDAFLLVDRSSKIRFANTAAHQLCNSHALIDRPIREAFIDPRLAKALSHCLESEEPVQTQVTLPQQASPLRNLETRGVNAWIIDAAKLPAQNEGQPLTRVIIRDMTSEHQTEQIRKDFVANASHELRTPMAIITGYLENLLDDDVLEDKNTSRRFLGVMRKHADRISRIIEDMLTISRLESGAVKQLNIEPFNLRECFQDILDRLESVIRTQNATIKVALPDDHDIILNGDRFYWVQSLFNLVENALKQNPHPGLEITIGAVEFDDHHEIWVCDNGVGIPSSDLPYIFGRFYRVDKQHSQSEIKGTGLGLSIVKRAIEAHGGSITAHSKPGSETKFLIVLPKAARPAASLNPLS